MGFLERFEFDALFSVRVRGGERGVQHQRHQGGAMRRPRRDQGMHQDFLDLSLESQHVLSICHVISDYSGYRTL